MKSVRICVTHLGGVGGIEDKTITRIMESHSASSYGSGYFIPTGERDLQFNVPPEEVETAVYELEKMGFTVTVKEIHG